MDLLKARFHIFSLARGRGAMTKQPWQNGFSQAWLTSENVSPRPALSNRHLIISLELFMYSVDPWWVRGAKTDRHTRVISAAVFEVKIERRRGGNSGGSQMEFAVSTL